MEELQTDVTKLDGCITTRSGIKFNLIDPKVEMVFIGDIASGLAYKGHFVGQTPMMFPVAQHSTLACDLVVAQEDPLKEDILFMLELLLHDSPEAYLFDCPKPIKVLPGFEKIIETEEKITAIIYKRFGIEYPSKRKPEIKKYDILAQQIEYDKFYKGGVQDMLYFSPEDARKRFLIYFNRFMSKLNPREIITPK